MVSLRSITWRNRTSKQSACNLSHSTSSQVSETGPLKSLAAEAWRFSIVAITGLAGRAFDSWANDQGSMWLRDYLPQELPGVRIFIYGYPSKLYKSVSRASLWDYTEGFMRAMARLTETSGVLS